MGTSRGLGDGPGHEEEDDVGALRRALETVRRRPQAQERAEVDAPADLGSARTRATGGVAQPGTQNPNATTGTTPNETFVGRAGADETLDTGLSGAEARAGEAADGRGEGAAREV
jgi:hypothetical protein